MTQRLDFDWSMCLLCVFRIEVNTVIQTLATSDVFYDAVGPWVCAQAIRVACISLSLPEDGSVVGVGCGARFS